MCSSGQEPIGSPRFPEPYLFDFVAVDLMWSPCCVSIESSHPRVLEVLGGWVGGDFTWGSQGLPHVKQVPAHPRVLEVLGVWVGGDFTWGNQGFPYVKYLQAKLSSTGAAGAGCMAWRCFHMG